MQILPSKETVSSFAFLKKYKLKYITNKTKDFFTIY